MSFTDLELVAEADDYISTSDIHIESLAVVMSDFQKLLARLYEEDLDLGAIWPELTRGIPELEGFDQPDEIADYGGLDGMFEHLGAHLSSEEWGGDMPGLSGNWIKVYASLEDIDSMVAAFERCTKQVRSWIEDSGRSRNSK